MAIYLSGEKTVYTEVYRNIINIKDSIKHNQMHAISRTFCFV